MLGLIVKAAVTGTVAYAVIKVLEKTGAAEKIVAFGDECLTKFKEGFEQEQKLQQTMATVRQEAENILKNVRGEGNV